MKKIFLILFFISFISFAQQKNGDTLKHLITGEWVVTSVEFNGKE